MLKQTGVSYIIPENLKKSGDQMDEIFKNILEDLLQQEVSRSVVETNVGQIHSFIWEVRHLL